MKGAFGPAGRVPVTSVAVFRLEHWARWLDACESLLSASESARAARQRRPGFAAMLRMAYALHRLVLGYWMGVAPEKVPLWRDSRGCPRVGMDGWHTSLSHADGRVAVAVSRLGPVGVDIELRGKAGLMPELAERVCTPLEKLMIESLPEHARALALLRLWVRKEALLKAAGVGLAEPMERTHAPEADWLRLPAGDARVRIEMCDVLPECVVAVAHGDDDPCLAAFPVAARAGRLALDRRPDA
ncbi:4'-phosphopantetheinyl transferase family protein [Marilutibacter alkalisoli]|nr:4'-phosphopantetheinyl transferase superfamily protein [Lysobacter alkalisoli]